MVVFSGKSPLPGPQPNDFQPRCPGYTVGKGSLFNMWYWDDWVPVRRKMKLDPYLIPCANIKSKCIKGLGMTSKTINS